MAVVRSVLAVLIGLVLISLLVEPIEFALVSLVNGGTTTDAVVYFDIRNRPAFLVVKLFYTTAAAVVGGYVTGWLAGRLPLAHGIILAIVQIVALAWAFNTPEMRTWTPDWMWVARAIVSTLGVIWGAWRQERRKAFAPTGRPLSPHPRAR
jgi:hypothetical protein